MSRRGYNGKVYLPWDFLDAWVSCYALNATVEGVNGIDESLESNTN
ncbi:MAG: hypothetical protein QXI71_03695 [Candidatus Bathyarchaeia archaeon]